MTKLSQADLIFLAKFAGGTRPYEEVCRLNGTAAYWYFPDPTNKQELVRLSTLNFDPAENPAHGWLVLKALMEKEQKRLEKQTAPQQRWARMGAHSVMESLTSRALHPMHEPFYIWPAVVDAALATRKDGN